MPTLRTTIRPAIRTTARLIPGSLGLAPAFNPSSLNPIQRFLDASPTYHGPTVAGYPVFTPEESYTSIAQPRSGRCWLFDGVNDFATRGARLTSGAVSALTIAFWINPTSIPAEYKTIIQECNNGFNQGYAVGLNNSDRTKVEFAFAAFSLFPLGGTPSVLVANTWTHVTFVYDGSLTSNANRLKCYVNGTQVSLTFANTIPASIADHSNAFGVGFYPPSQNYLPAKLKDIIIEQAAWSDAEVLSLYTNHTIPEGKTPLAFYRCEEESGTTGYNSLANSNHLTLTNITQSTFHALDTGVRYSDANERGHTVSGSVIIPRSVATPTQDVAGNTLGVTGPVAKLATAEVRCVTGDGSAVYGSATLAVGTTLTICARVRFAATGTQAIIAVNGSASNGVLLRYDGNTTIQWFSNTGNAVQNITVPSLVGSWHHVAITHTGSNYAFYLNGALISSGTLGPLWVAGNEVAVGRYNSSGGINYLNGSISDVRIYSDVKTQSEIQAIRDGFDNRTNIVAHWPIQEGPGTANTNRTIYDTVGSNNLTLVNGTVSNIWANYCPFVRSHCVEYGGNVAANGSFIPGRIGSNLDAAGNVKLLLPGEPSQYDLIYPNRWNMPALVNVGITSSTAWGKTTTVQATSPADTKFRNTTKGTKNIVVREPLVDPAKTQLQDYVSA